MKSGLEESQAGIKIAGKKNQQSQICRWYHSNGRKQRGTKEPLDKSESEKAGLKLNIQKTKFTSWQIDGETMETVTDFLFLGSKITVDSDYAMKLEDACFLERKLWQT